MLGTQYEARQHQVDPPSNERPNAGLPLVACDLANWAADLAKKNINLTAQLLDLCTQQLRSGFNILGGRAGANADDVVEHVLGAKRRLLGGNDQRSGGMARR
jgi:hypothetical protein